MANLGITDGELSATAAPSQVATVNEQVTRAHMCNEMSRKCPHPPPLGVAMAKVLRKKYDAKLEFSEGLWGGGGGMERRRGANLKTLRGGCIFSGTSHYLLVVIMLFLSPPPQRQHVKRAR